MALLSTIGEAEGDAEYSPLSSHEKPPCSFQFSSFKNGVAREPTLLKKLKQFKIWGLICFKTRFGVCYMSAFEAENSGESS